MSMREGIRGFSRIVVLALAFTAFGTVGWSVHEASARGFGCVDYGCTVGEAGDKACQKHECDVCHSDSRCALNPE